MAKNDQEEAYDKILTGSLARVGDLLKFAEAKNAALLTFSSAWILGSINVLTKVPTPAGDFVAGLLCALPLFACAAAICMVSLLPTLQIRPRAKVETRSKNLLFFGDIALMPSAEFTAKLRAEYLAAENRSVTEPYIEHLSEQIWANSKITNRKFRFFNLAAAFTGCAVAVVVLTPALLQLYRLVRGALS